MRAHILPPRLLIAAASAALAISLSGCGGSGGGGGNSPSPSSPESQTQGVEGTWYPDMVDLNNQLEASAGVSENGTIVRTDAQTIKYADGTSASIDSGAVAGKNISGKPPEAQGGTSDARLGQSGPTGYTITSAIASQTVKYGKSTLVLRSLNDPAGIDRSNTWKTLPEAAWAGNWTAVYVVASGPGAGSIFTVKASLNYQLSSSTSAVYVGMGYLDKLAQVTLAIQDDTTAAEKSLLAKYFNMTSPEQNYIEGINAKNQPNKVNQQYAFGADHPLINGKDAGGELVLVLQANGGVIDQAPKTSYDAQTYLGATEYNDLLANGTWLVVRPPNRLVATLHTGGFRKLATHFNAATDLQNQTFGAVSTFGENRTVFSDIRPSDMAQYVAYAFVPDLFVSGQIYDYESVSKPGAELLVSKKDFSRSDFRVTDDAARHMTYAWLNASTPTGNYAAGSNWGGAGTQTTQTDPGTYWGAYQSQFFTVSWVSRWLADGRPQNMNYGLAGIWQYNDNADAGFAKPVSGSSLFAGDSLARAGFRTYNGGGGLGLDGQSHMALNIDSVGLGTFQTNGQNQDASQPRVRPDYASASYMVGADAAGRTTWKNNGQSIRSVRAKMNVWTDTFGANDAKNAQQSKIAQDLTGTIYYLDHVAIYSGIPENGRPGDTARTPVKVSDLSEIYSANPNLN